MAVKWRTMTLAIFDLDNTLLGGDSDHAWGEFVCELGLVEGGAFRPLHDAFHADYQAGRLDVDAYLRHALSPLAGRSVREAGGWQRRFLREKIEPMILPAALELIERHRAQGHELLIITATNRFVTAPIAERLGVPHLIACDAEIRDGHYTGEPVGIPSFGAGKVARLQAWLRETGRSAEGCWFYSDSHNDLPLLEFADHPVAVDPDEKLRAAARERGWPIISLRGPSRQPRSL